MANQAMNDSGLSKEFMDMLEPSFALLRRLTQEDHRSHTENELKLRIEGLELRAQRLEAEKMTLESRLQELTSEKTSLECRLQDIEKATSATEHRVLALEKTVLSTTTSNTPDDQTGERAIETVRHPRNPTPVLGSAELVPVPLKLHRLMPGILFLVEPEGMKLLDSSQFTHDVLSSFRSTFTTMLDEHVEKTRLEELRRAHRTGSGMMPKGDRCLYTQLRHAQSANGNVWTREHPHLYACKTCVNTQRLCMSVVQDEILALSLHPLLRTGASNQGAANDDLVDGSVDQDDDFDVRPTDLGYWIPTKNNLTRAVPYNRLDIWTAS